MMDESKKEICVALLSRIREGKYPYPENSRPADGDHLILFLMLSNSIISSTQVHYIDVNQKLVSVPKGNLY